MNVTWKMDNKELTVKNGVKLEKDLNKNRFTLIIPKVNSSFGKEIECEVKNEHGTVKRSVALILLGNCFLRLINLNKRFV